MDLIERRIKEGRAHNTQSQVRWGLGQLALAGGVPYPWQDDLNQITFKALSNPSPLMYEGMGLGRQKGVCVLRVRRDETHVWHIS